MREGAESRQKATKSWQTARMQRSQSGLWRREIWDQKSGAVALEIACEKAQTSDSSPPVESLKPL